MFADESIEIFGLTCSVWVEWVALPIGFSLRTNSISFVIDCFSRVALVCMFIILDSTWPIMSIMSTYFSISI
jgi:hypothetical protein